MFNYNNNLAFEQFLFAVYVTIVTIGYINTCTLKAQRNTFNYAKDRRAISAAFPSGYKPNMYKPVLVK